MTEGSFGRLTDPPATFTIVGARVIDPSDGTDAVRDISVVDGLISPAADPAAERIEGHGLIVAPGLCDLHAHLREPGDDSAETADSGARAAAKGGFTTICAMPNTDPALDSPAAVAGAQPADSACRVRVIGAATIGRAGSVPADLAGMADAGAVAFSDDGASVADARVARRVMATLAELRLPLVEHAEDSTLAGDGVMREGPWALRLGLAGWPAGAEVAVIERDAALAEETGAHLHVTHLSTAAGLDAIRAARARGIRVTCDVTPHHLAMTDEWVAGSRSFAWEEPRDATEIADLAYDGACRVNPPLPSRSDALALLAGVGDGTIDAIATDHAPHPPERKLVPFAEAAPGLIGLETALSLGLNAVESGALGLSALMAAMSTRPGSIIGEDRAVAVGAVADLVLIDPAARWLVRPHGMASRSANTPLVGMELPGVVRLTVSGGRVTYRS
jgi:dihydroorotase